MKKAIRFIIPGVVLLAVLGIFLYNRLTAIVPKNPSDTIGNTPGNLLSGGGFCESDGTIFFSNPYDGGKLYSMDADCTNIKYLSTDSVSYINTAGKYVYYVKANTAANSSSTAVLDSDLFGIVRSLKDGSRKNTLRIGYATDMALFENSLVFNGNRNGVNVTYTVPIRGGNVNNIADSDYTNACVVNGEVISSGLTEDDNAIYAMNLSDGNIRLYLDANTAMATVVDNSIYFIDLDNGNRLTRLNLMDASTTILSEEPVALYNVYNGIVFYQTTGDNPALIRVYDDGSVPTTVVDGTVTSIYCTSIYTFFQFEGSEALYRTGTYTGGGVQTFFIEVA